MFFFRSSSFVPPHQLHFKFNLSIFFKLLSKGLLNCQFYLYEQKTSSQHLKVKTNITFFPNPVSDNLRIRSLFKFETYQIYDINGKQVADGTGGGTYTDLNISYLQAGVYFVKIAADDLQATIRLLKK